MNYQFRYSIQNPSQSLNLIIQNDTVSTRMHVWEGWNPPEKQSEARTVSQDQSTNVEPVLMHPLENRSKTKGDLTRDKEHEGFSPGGLACEWFSVARHWMWGPMQSELIIRNDYYTVRNNRVKLPRTASSSRSSCDCRFFTQPLLRIRVESSQDSSFSTLEKYQWSSFSIYEKLGDERKLKNNFEPFEQSRTRGVPSACGEILIPRLKINLFNNLAFTSMSTNQRMITKDEDIQLVLATTMTKNMWSPNIQGDCDKAGNQNTTLLLKKKSWKPLPKSGEGAEIYSFPYFNYPSVPQKIDVVKRFFSPLEERILFTNYRLSTESLLSAVRRALHISDHKQILNEIRNKMKELSLESIKKTFSVSLSSNIRSYINIGMNLSTLR